MPRFTSLFLAILAGGIAVGIGMGIFLHLANADRERLAGIAKQAQAQTRDAQAARDQAVHEANQKLQNANAEIAKAQTALTSLQLERDLIADAKGLTVTSARAVRGWKQAINLELNATCKFPPTSDIESNDTNGLVVTQTGSDPSTDNRWLSILPYDAQRENEMQDNFVTSTPVSFLVDGHLLIGKHGQMSDPRNDVYILRVQKEGIPSHLIWLKDPATDTDGTVALNVLASLSFQN